MASVTDSYEPLVSASRALISSAGVARPSSAALGLLSHEALLGGCAVPLSDHGLRQLAQAGEGDGRHLRCGRVLRPAGLQRVVPKLLAGEVVR